MVLAQKRWHTVGVFGLGIVGLPTALHISRFFRVKGYDINKKAVERAMVNGIDSTTNWQGPSKEDVFVLAVSTGIAKNYEADVSAIRDVFAKISEGNPSSLVCVESTTPAGTLRKLSMEFNLRHVVHCPHRYWRGDPINYGVVQMRVLGAVDEESLTLGKRFYETLGIPVTTVSSIEVAEMSKVAENAYFFVEISFAEELSLICRKLGLSFDEVRDACNTKWSVRMLEARDGIGGHCLPKDTRYLWNVLRSPLLGGAIRADEEYKKTISSTINERYERRTHV